MMTQETNSLSNQSGDAADHPKPASSPRIGLAIIAAILFVISIFMLNISASTYFRGLASLSYKMIDASVYEVVEHFDPMGISKEVTMAYNVDGQEIKAPAMVPSGRLLKRGEKTVVFCDVKNPHQIVLEQVIDYDVVTVMGAFGLFALSFAVLLAVKARK